jgi:opacity protein-like surface antigen
MIRLFPSILAALGATSSAHAEEWKHTLVPYLWASAMDGTTGIGTPLGPVEADVDISFGDIWDNLEIGGMVSYRVERGRWAIMGDLIYMDLETDKTGSAGPIRVDATVEVQQTAFEVDVGYRVTERVLAYAGWRYNDLNADLEVIRTGPGPGATRVAGTSETWVDPMIGVIIDIPLADRWTVALRGDVGGFGVGSDFAWQAAAFVSWQATDAIHVIGGYRYIDMDYEDGEGTSLFKYDMAISGPVLGVAFTF